MASSQEWEKQNRVIFHFAQDFFDRGGVEVWQPQGTEASVAFPCEACGSQDWGFRRYAEDLEAELPTHLCAKCFLRLEHEAWRLIDPVGAGRREERREQGQRHESERSKLWRAVGIAGLVVLAATVTNVFGSPYEGEPLSLALLLGALLQIFLVFAGIVYGAVLAYRIGKWTFFKIQARRASQR